MCAGIETSNLISQISPKSVLPFDAGVQVARLEPDSTTADKSSGLIISVSVRRQESARTIYTKVQYQTFHSSTMNESHQIIKK